MVIMSLRDTILSFLFKLVG